jgi:hypothetical protein
MTGAAVSDFSRALDGGMEAYREAVRDFVLRLYGNVAPEGATHFLDKSPPYALFMPELARIFPEARFIALWRNPLAVVASVVETFCEGRWEPDRYSVSLFASLEALVEATKRHRERIYAVRFEDLASGDYRAWRGLADFIGIEFDPESLTGFTRVSLDGRLGDPTGVVRYSELSSEPLTKWRQTITTPLRKSWCRHYLNWIGPERLSIMGYDPMALRAELDSTPVGSSGLGLDVLHWGKSAARELAGGRLRKRGRGILGGSAARFDRASTSIREEEGDASI